MDWTGAASAGGQIFQTGLIPPLYQPDALSPATQLPWLVQLFRVRCHVRRPAPQRPTPLVPRRHRACSRGTAGHDVLAELLDDIRHGVRHYLVDLLAGRRFRTHLRCRQQMRRTGEPSRQKRHDIRLRSAELLGRDPLSNRRGSERQSSSCRGLSKPQAMCNSSQNLTLFYNHWRALPFPRKNLSNPKSATLAR